ncbi:hypothetical protein M7I_0300 [Glarea lozoyensis 74030]|uniref:Uncharacterized protein n=1 Tax=Glarea lozoyensis (strain ATCC 74030 / MF5533) TaxID=1104152 RepID=H0ED02_GLAL7|nr:hypothetical protein M7I_0300 [Glarea lozoyensis 74030]
METINNLASKAANVVGGKQNTAATDESVPRSMQQNDSIGGSSQPNYSGTTDPLGHTNNEAPIGGPSSTAHSNVKEPGFTQNPSLNSSEMGARDDVTGTSHLGKGVSDSTHSTNTESESKSDPLGHTNNETPIGGPSSTAHSNVKEPGFTTEPSSEEMGARADIKGATPAQGIPTAPRAADSKPADATDTKGAQYTPTSREPDSSEKEEVKKDDDGHILKPGSAEAKVQGKSVLPTSERPYGESGIPDVVEKDLKSDELNEFKFEICHILTT